MINLALLAGTPMPLPARGRDPKDLDVPEILRRFALVLADRTTAAREWETQAEYLAPWKRGFLSDSGALTRPEGEKLTEHLFDSTALEAMDQLVGTLAANLVPKSMLWTRVVARDEALNKIDAAAEWFEEASWRLHLGYAMSNFHAEVPELVHEAPLFGTGAMLQEERERVYPGFNGFRFRALPLARLALGQNADGEVDTAYRWFDVSAKAAVDKWGAAHVGDPVVTLARSAPNAPVRFLHKICPRPGGEPGYGATRKPFASYLVCLHSLKMALVSGYDEFPVQVWRWRRRADAVYGRGLGELVLPDVKTLNKAVELDLRGWSKDLDPPAVVEHDQVIGPVRSNAGGVTIVEPGHKVEWFTSGTRYEVNQIKIAEYQAKVRRILYADRLPPMDQNQKATATEILARRELIDQLMALPVGRCESEALTKLNERGLAMLLRAGALPPLPPELEGAEIDFEYLGPLARVARLDEALAIERFEAQLAAKAQTWPEVIDLYDPDEGTRYGARVQGVPAKVLRSEAQVRALRAAKGRRAMEAEADQAALASAEGLGKVAPFVKAISPGGPLAALPAGTGA